MARVYYYGVVSKKMKYMNIPNIYKLNIENMFYIDSKKDEWDWILYLYQGKYYKVGEYGAYANLAKLQANNWTIENYIEHCKKAMFINYEKSLLACLLDDDIDSYVDTQINEYNNRIGGAK